MNINRLLLKDGSHYFFGFHDLSPTNFKDTKYLALKIDEITSPPSGKKPVSFGVIEGNEFRTLGSTLAFNYPQGARQQWIGDSDLVIINNRRRDKWCATIFDTENGKEEIFLENSCHCITKDGIVLGIDYARLHRLGGYGYTGIPDNTLNENAPKKTGITVENINNQLNEILISVSDVANFEMNENEGIGHYLTHLVLSPHQKKVAFLHRYRYKDGGEGTRLMVIEINTRSLCCVAKGVLSHFDWLNEDNIFIWGSTSNNIIGFRQSNLYKYLPEDFLYFGKKIYHTIREKTKKEQGMSTTHSWLKINVNTGYIEKDYLKSIIDEDGHPMFNPKNRDWMVCDNYPNQSGIRSLFLYNHKLKKKLDIGKFRMINELPDIQKSKEGLKDVDSKVLRQFSFNKMAFYRSGIHCDLHPRWSSSGKFISFDSIHEGRRAIYSVKVDTLIG